MQGAPGGPEYRWGSPAGREEAAEVQRGEVKRRASVEGKSADPAPGPHTDGVRHLPCLFIAFPTGRALGPTAQVDVFREDLCTKTENLLGSYFPKKISELDTFLKEPALNEANLSNLKAPLDIPVPDPVKEKEKEERKKQQEKEDKDAKKKDDEDKGPPCGPVNCNEKIVILLQRLKPEIKDVIEQLNLVTTWLQLQIPRIEDGNNFGVAVQEKVFELMTALHTKLEGFHSQISKYFSERGDAVAKAAKQPHVGDYRQLVHELDEAEYRDIRLMVMEIRNAYAVLYDIILKNFEKLKKPRGETKGMIY
ncbi:proteasome activator complex subunit 1 isoform X1 [Artibeus jamaicensis]|uniref:proteasome activator complex subunit 1 isoform X1 n=1 Tax=Artibeus jamaicensis TaxID=9417 RepID=UPI00235AA959|nr:proteasome activator complex subunit 1 isoform X1 [Artibeus jamaicensis]